MLNNKHLDNMTTYPLKYVQRVCRLCTTGTKLDLPTIVTESQNGGIEFLEIRQQQLLEIRQEPLTDSVTIEISKFIFHLPLIMSYICSYGFKIWNIKQNQSLFLQ